jgi:hypothetical protein
VSEHLTWALGRARALTLLLVADVRPDQMHLQSAPGERHPAWLLGHLLLADTYLLSLLDVQPLSDDFPSLLQRYGPKSVPASASDDGDPRDLLVENLVRTNTLRLAKIRQMTDHDLAQPMRDAFLAQAQPTIGHHLQSLVFHEGYHSGQLSSWRKAHGFGAVHWTLGPASSPAAR